MPGPETIFQRDGLGSLAVRLAELGTKRVLVLAAPSRRHVDLVTGALEQFRPDVFDGARVHVPAEVVEAASARLTETGADTIVTIGGGSTVGLGKALRLTHDVRFVAVPATYAGSEMTTMFGVTRERDKQTGRDDRVRPDIVFYDVSLTRDMPIALTVQSLVNALAHVASVISTGTLEDRASALAGAAMVLRAIEDLLLAPRDLVAREQALRGASACAAAFDRGTPGAQHALAHLLGGALGVEHAPLHAVLLPHFLAHLRVANPGALDELERAVDRADLDAYVFDLLVRARAPVSLDALGAVADAVRAALAKRPELPAGIALDAQHGLRPPGRGGRIDLGSEPHALLAGPHPIDAERVVLVLHGRGAEAGTFVRRMREIVGFDPDTCVVGLRAEQGAERWYAVRYGEAGAGSDPEVLHAIERVETAIAALRRIGAKDIFLAGFSQGACLALEVAARHKGRLAGVIAPCGARIGQPSEWEPAGTTVRVRQVLLGAAQYDKWIARSDLDATRRWFEDDGDVTWDVSGPGERHEITLRQRDAIRQILLEVRHPTTSGFGNTVTSEALAGAVPALQNSPRVPPHGLYAEQLNGTAFTAPRAENHRVWLYRTRPSAQRRAFTPFVQAHIVSQFDGAPEANLVGFAPMPHADTELDFIDGLVTLCGAGSAASRRGYAFHRYAANRSMESRAFYNADGDLLILPDVGTLTIATELGFLTVPPGHVAIIPRGIVFSVLLAEGKARGYVAEAFGRHFKLPERGPVGANGLADPRHFRAPAAWFEDRLAPDFRVIAKLGGALHEASQDHSPFDVAGWHGNYAPYSYDLAAFSSVGNTRFDHGDPSIFSVLTSEHLDLIVFPTRIDATTGTFRPPFFHRNTISEINGIIREVAHPGSAFQPGCAFITPALTAHGPSGRAVERQRTLTTAEADKPLALGGETALWFQFESALSPVLTPWAKDHALPDWAATWGKPSELLPVTDAELELAFYEKFFFSKNLEPYPVQEQAIGHIFAGKSLLVTVPTGTGKTVMAKAALYRAIEQGQKAIYTTPLRALTEEKFRELCEDFGEANVGFATGDYKVNREAPIQVEVAEILWNRIVADKHVSPADIVVMDEGHYFNDPERGYVWEQSIIGLDPRTQLVILSATVGHADRFCQWVEVTRRMPMLLVDSRERKVPLIHEYREEMLIDTVRDLAHSGDVPAIVFVFGREQCFEVARLLKSCRRFTTDEEKARVEALCDEALLPAGVAKELRPLFGHGIGIHHAGILPRYKQLVEQLALERLIKFVVSTETIAAGINLPAKTVVFPSLRKFIKQQARMITAAEYHQMAGRAGRPQFDDKGLAITLAPEQIVSDLKKELKDAAKRPAYDEQKVKRSVYGRAKADAVKKNDVVWTPEMHDELVRGEPAELRSKTKITAEQVLAIGLPDLTEAKLPGTEAEVRMAAAEASLPPSMRLDIVTVIENLLLTERERKELIKTLTQLVDNLKAIGVIDEHGKQVSGEMIRQLQGMDGLFIYYVLFNHQLDYVELRELVEYLIDHDIIQRVLDRKGEDAKREWTRTWLREQRFEGNQVTWEDAEAAYDKEHPRQLTKIEIIHGEFAGKVPHPELHGGKKAKTTWSQLEDSGLSFLEFVEKHHIEHEEGNLFSYLVRVMNFSNKLYEASQLSEFQDMAERVQKLLARIDLRIVERYL